PFATPRSADLYIIDLHTFPTRRSSDLRDPRRPGLRREGDRVPARHDRPRRHPLGAVLPADRRKGRAWLSPQAARVPARPTGGSRDRKSTRLNSSHVSISYAVFCLKKKT